MDEAVDGGDGDGFAGKEFGPILARLVCGEEDGSAFVSHGDEFEEDAGLGFRRSAGM